MSGLIYVGLIQILEILILSCIILVYSNNYEFAKYFLMNSLVYDKE